MMWEGGRVLSLCPLRGGKWFGVDAPCSSQQDEVE